MLGFTKNSPLPNQTSAPIPSYLITILPAL